jgi:hypothetical protein
VEKEEENTLLHALATPLVFLLAPKRINKLVLMLLLLLLLLRENDKEDDDGNNAAALRAARCIWKNEENTNWNFFPILHKELLTLLIHTSEKKKKKKNNNKHSWPRKTRKWTTLRRIP